MNGIVKKVKEYVEQADISANAHYMEWERLSLNHKILGAFVVCCATIVGTTFFADQVKKSIGYCHAFTGLMSILTAVLSTLQTFLKFSESAESHKLSGLNYSHIRRNAEMFLMKYDSDNTSNRDEALNEVLNIIDDFKKVAEDSLGVPEKIWNKAKDKVKLQKADSDNFCLSCPSATVDQPVKPA